MVDARGLRLRLVQVGDEVGVAVVEKGGLALVGRDDALAGLRPARRVRSR